MKLIKICITFILSIAFNSNFHTVHYTMTSHKLSHPIRLALITDLHSCKYGNTLIDAFCELLGINSPSKVFIAIGGFIVAGLIYGIQDSAAFLGFSIQEIISHMFEIAGDLIQNGIPYLVDVVKTLGSKLLEGLKASDIDLGSLFVLGSMVTVAFFLKKIYDTLDKLTGGVTSPLKALGGMLNAVTDLLKSIKSNIKAVRIRVYAEAIKNIAMSIAIMAGVFIALSKIDIPNAKQSIGIMLSIVAMLGMLTFAAAKLEPAGFGRFSLFLICFVQMMKASLYGISLWKYGRCYKETQENF